MTKGEIITLAARKLGDTSAAFIADVVSPFLELVLLELASNESIEQVRKSVDFEVVSGQRGYSTREITGQVAHSPMAIEQIMVYAWGPTHARVPRLDWEQFQALRVDGGETQTGMWQAWRLFPNSDNLEVYPPAGAAEAVDDNDNTVLAQVVYVASPRSYLDTQELPDIHAEDIPAIVAGMVKHGAPFGDETMVDAQMIFQQWEMEKARMWGRRWNGRPGRIVGQSY